MTDVGKACALRRGRSGHREIVTFIEVDDRSRDSRDRHELGPSRKYLNEVKALLASVRHTGAFPNSARLVRVSCLECVFRVHASVVPPV